MSAGDRPPGDSPIRLLVSDIDGTLVTPEKVLTPAALKAVADLEAGGVMFSIVSARPPRGMAHLVESLKIRQPFAAFNGAALLRPDLTVIQAARLPAEVSRLILARLAAAGVDAWVFADDTWRLRDPHGAEVPRERLAVGFEPTVVADFEDVIDRIDKIVGVSDDAPRLAALETDAAGFLAGQAIGQRSQAYYLDFTAPEANKGHAVKAICDQIGVGLHETAVIGDMANDVAMFQVAGFAIAMGQSPDSVKARATVSTDANTAEGFANAVARLILPRAPR